MKKLLAEYTTFSSKESLIAILVLIFGFAIFVVPFLVNEKKITPTPITQKIEFKTDSGEKKNTYQNQKKYYANNELGYEDENPKELTPFNFDPNTLSAEGFEKLGLPAKTARTIINYRNKGGRFYKPDDFRKIWGLTTEQANILVPYIQLPNAKGTNSNSYSKNFNNTTSNNAPSIVDINTATAYDLKKLPSLGNLAYKIVNFRDKLGGFISIDQIKETYGMTDSVFLAIKPFLQLQTQETRKLNINTATDFELSQHPYIATNVAKAIVIYRNQKGAYKNIEDVKKIVFIKEATFSKIAPYITVQ